MQIKTLNEPFVKDSFGKCNCLLPNYRHTIAEGVLVSFQIIDSDHIDVRTHLHFSVFIPTIPWCINTVSVIDLFSPAVVDEHFVSVPFHTFSITSETIISTVNIWGKFETCQYLNRYEADFVLDQTLHLQIANPMWLCCPKKDP